LKISEYKLREFDPESCDELITEVDFSHYGFKCHGEVYTSNGELDDDYIVTAKMKFIGTFKEKDGTIKTIIDYDSTASEINEDTVRELIDFCAKWYYQ
jgi:hypothetical protein